MYLSPDIETSMCVGEGGDAAIRKLWATYLTGVDYHYCVISYGVS